jgi:hypothetical protein
MVDFKRTLPFTTPVDVAAMPDLGPQRRKSKSRPSLRPGDTGSRSGGSGRTLPPPPGEWIAKGRALSKAIELSIGAANPMPKVLAAIERAYAAYFLDDVPEHDIAQIAHLCERAHEAIRKLKPAQVDAGIGDCAKVLYLGLPGYVRRRAAHDDVVNVVRGLRAESIRLRAVTQATLDLLGWLNLYRERAEQIVQGALRDYPSAADPGD